MTMGERPVFDASILSDVDLRRASIILGADLGLEADQLNAMSVAMRRLACPDATIFDATGTVPYLYRWHIIPRNDFANVYFHIQVADDPDERGPHDHSYHSSSTLLAGAYWDDTFKVDPIPGMGQCELILETSLHLRKGDMIRRTSYIPHRLRLADGEAYTMTLFCTGPRHRPWGFYDPDGTWHAADENGEIINGIASGRAKT